MIVELSSHFFTEDPWNVHHFLGQNRRHLDWLYLHGDLSLQSDSEWQACETLRDWLRALELLQEMKEDHLVPNRASISMDHDPTFGRDGLCMFMDLVLIRCVYTCIYIYYIYIYLCIYIYIYIYLPIFLCKIM